MGYIRTSSILPTGNAIKSIQRGVISWNTTAGENSGTATINSVDTTKSIVRHLGLNYTDANGGTFLTLTNSTTVTATALCGQANAYKVSYEVIEFE